jgi:hypothetical protein
MHTKTLNSISLINQFVKETQYLLVACSARDGSGKPTGVRLAPRGLGTDSPVPLRLAWQAAKKMLKIFLSRHIGKLGY